MEPAPHGLLGRLQRASDDDAHRFGPHTAEVEAFIQAAAQLTPFQWHQVLATKRLVAAVSKEGSSDSASSIQNAIRTSDTRISEPIARAGEVLFDALIKETEEKQVAAWQAMTALVMRSQMPALKFAVHYAPFAAMIPLADAEVLDPRTRRFMAKLRGLGKQQLEQLAQRWRIEPGASRALLQAVGKTRHVKSEEAVAMAALTFISNHLSGDVGWSALRTAVHGGRTLGAMVELTPEEIAELWAPIEPVIPLASLDEPEPEGAPAPAAAPAPVTEGGPAPRPTRRSRTRIVAEPGAAKAAAPYGPNQAEVEAFLRGVAQLTPIQWLRVLDRRKLVSSITREGAAQPAGVVRSILAMLEATRELDSYLRCRAFVAVERAGFALESRLHASPEQVHQVLLPFEPAITVEVLNGGGFAHQVAALDKAQWQRIATTAPDATEEAVAPLVNAGTELTEFLSRRTDDEAVAAWHAISALVHRRHLPPIKFAASYAPFASAIPVTSPRSLGAMVSRYVTAVGRLGSSQCAALARELRVDDELSSVLAGAAATGAARTAEEAAALAAVVTVPMRLTGPGGWAAVKAAAFGGKVMAMRTRLTAEQLEALWAPIEPAIPLASLSAPSRGRR